MKRTDYLRRSHRRVASVLLEFAFIALILFLLLAATLDLGRATFSAQALQTAVDLAARELSRTPLPPDMKFEDALKDATVRQQIFDEKLLVVDRNNIPDLPLVNQQLLPLMIPDEIDGQQVLRYPGAVARDGSGFRVFVPIVTGRDADGVETIEWRRVLEEIEPTDTSNPKHDPFRITSELRGVVALRLNYPFQAAALTGYRQDADGTLTPIRADDAAVNDPGLPEGEALIPSDRPVSPYAGPFGLGKQLAFVTEVRPFRRVVSVQAIFRREVFSGSN